MTESTSADFYDCHEGCDELTHQTVDYAVEYHLDALSVEHWPDTLRVCAFAREQLPLSTPRTLADLALERVYEFLDEEYGDPEESSGVSAPVKAAAEAFGAAVVAGFVVWRCKRVPAEDETVDVAAWVKENTPEWLDDPEIAAWVAERSGR